MAESYHYGPNGQGPQDDSGQGQQNQQHTYRYKYSYGSGSNRNPQPPRPPRNSGGFGDWIGIGILFLLPFWFTKVISVIWLMRKLGSMNKNQNDQYHQEARRAAERVKRSAGQTFDQSAQGWTPSVPTAAPNPGQSRTQPSASWNTRTQQPSAPQPEDQSPRYQREARRNAAKKQARKDAAGGTGLIIGGAVTSGIFALGSAAVFIEYLRYVVNGANLFNDELIGVLACAMFMVGGLAMLFSGIHMNRSSERYVNYLAYIGANREVSLAPMAASFDVPVNRLCKDLRKMLAKGILPSGYLDLSDGKLYLTEMGYRAPEPKQPEPEPQETAQQAAEREDDILRQIRQINDEIPDEVMTAKINRIEEITGKILTYQKTHPHKEGQLRSFLNYYLPTTLKILRAYAQLEAQGIEGENISAAKTRIEGMMDQVVAGFEKQLDKLFRDDAMDITSDVQVLENMLKKDGLSDDGITMKL